MIEEILKTRQVQLQHSDDGSHTIVLRDRGISYHSTNGAMSESNHVFIKNGFNAIPLKKIRILEMGMGTGLNVLLTTLEAKKQRKVVNYTAFELYPLDLQLAGLLNYPEMLPGSEVAFRLIHEGGWNLRYSIGDWVQLLKRKEDFCLAKLEENRFDLVYYDPFAPGDQAALWQPEIWSRLFRGMACGGALVTYCAKGQVRRDMMAAGFSVERLEGARGKREMLRAWKAQ